MSSEGMASKMLERANKLYEIGMKAFKVNLKLYGTDFVVLRPKDNSKWKNVFGGSYSSDSTLENDYEQFTVRLAVSLNDMRDVWNRNRDIIEVPSENPNLEVGDELQYTRNGRTFRFKIIQKSAFSEAAEILFMYTLSSIIETLDT